MWRELTQVTKEAGYVVCTLKKIGVYGGGSPVAAFCSSRMEGVQKNFDGEFTGGWRVCHLYHRIPEVGHSTQVPGRTRKARRRKECSYVTETRSGFVKAFDLAFESTRRNDGVFGAW